MKLIDQTPYINTNGELSLVNHVAASLKFGSTWYPEIKAQQVVVDILNRNLAKGYTLLRNITLPGTKANLPLVLIGPAGVFTMVVTPLKGTYQAKGEVWGMYSGEKVRVVQPNLLMLADKMARALQRYLAKQGCETSVEGILIATDPGLHIESTRPIVRVVMRDGIENYINSINQAIPALVVTISQTIVDLLIEPGMEKSTKLQSQGETGSVVETQVNETQAEEQISPELEQLLPWAGEQQEFGSTIAETGEGKLQMDFFMEDEQGPDVDAKRKSKPLPLGFTGKQWALLGMFGVVELILLLIFYWMVSGGI